MAVVFELVVNFGHNEQAATAARTVVGAHGKLTAAGFEFEIAPPFVTPLSRPDGGQRYIEFSVHPRGISHGGPGPKPADFDVHDADDGLILEVGRHLYRLLQRFDGYEAAMVGWDPEGVVDVDELRDDWLADEAIFDLHGLVLRETLLDLWGIGHRFEPFAPGFRWLPYSGTSPLN